MRVLIGERDPTFNVTLMQATYLAWYPDSLPEVLPNAGHYPAHEVPLCLVTNIERYLRAASC